MDLQDLHDDRRPDLQTSCTSMFIHFVRKRKHRYLLRFEFSGQCATEI